MPCDCDSDFPSCGDDVLPDEPAPDDPERDQNAIHYSPETPDKDGCYLSWDKDGDDQWRAWCGAWHDSRGEWCIGDGQGGCRDDVTILAWHDSGSTG